MQKHKKEGIEAYKAKKAGRPKLEINPSFRRKIVEIRKSDDYGSEKIHFVLKEEGFTVSQHIIQRILDEHGLTKPCEKLRGKRKYVRYQWPISNYMWHTDWSFYNGKWIIAFIDDRSRKIMAAGMFDNATTENTIFVFYQAMLMYGVCPVIVLSDKGSQFYANIKTNDGKRAISSFEEELSKLGIDLWTSRRNHPQTNGKMEKWFDTLKKHWKKHPEKDLQEIVKWYNERRIHHALNYKTPEFTYWENL